LARVVAFLEAPHEGLDLPLDIRGSAQEQAIREILFLGELPDGGRVEAVVTGDRDPGYGSTSKMIAESALCLARDVQGEGGIWTPGALMGPALRKRLKERAGLTFSAR
jgi:short subunit dehydrogenase-like uncharacterized protein